MNIVIQICGPIDLISFDKIFESPFTMYLNFLVMETVCAQQHLRVSLLELTTLTQLLYPRRITVLKDLCVSIICITFARFTNIFLLQEHIEDSQLLVSIICYLMMICNLRPFFKC